MPYKLVSIAVNKTIEAIMKLNNEQLARAYEKYREVKIDSSIPNHQNRISHLLKLIESEGKRRQILYFLDSDELVWLCHTIFNK